MFRYVSGFSSLRSLFPMSTPSELLSGYGRGEVSYNDMITRIGATLRRHGLGTTLRVHIVLRDELLYCKVQYSVLVWKGT